MNREKFPEKVGAGLGVLGLRAFSMQRAASHPPCHHSCALVGRLPAVQGSHVLLCHPERHPTPCLPRTLPLCPTAPRCPSASPA